MFFENVYKGVNQFWAYLVTIFVVIFAYVLGSVPFMVVLLMKASESGLGQAEIEEFTKSMDFEAIGIDSNVGFLLLLFTFITTFFALWLMVAKVHKRSFKTLITPFENINWSKIFFGFGLWMFFSFLLEGLSYIMDPELYVWQFDISKFLPLLLISLVLLPIQTSTEELLFRGYFLQGLGAIFKSKLFPLIITSVLFGLMHIANPEVAEFGTGIMMTYYIGMGLFLGILTVMDDSLELALGIHAANNIFGATVVTFEGSALQTSSLLRTTEVQIELMLPVFIVLASVFTFICAKKYGWTNWGKLNGKIAPQALESNEIADHLLE